MRMRLVPGLLLCGLSSLGMIRAQGVDPNLEREATAVRAGVARSNAALLQYTWTEFTDVLVDGKVKSSKGLQCRYDSSGALTKTFIGTSSEKAPPSAVSRRPIVREKADMQDYIERAVSRIHVYMPPKPEEIDHLLQNGSASLGPSGAGESQVRFTHYFEDGDSLTVVYNSISKVVLRVDVVSTLGSPKDPVTMEALFETLPDGVNHLSSTILNAKSKKVQVKTRNVGYQKVAN